MPDAACALFAARPSGSCAATGARAIARATALPYAFTCPATPRYRHQWYWDSCFHAIAWRHLDPAARAGRAAHAGARRAPGRLHPAHRVLGPPAVLAPGAVLRHAHGVRLRPRPRRSRRRCSRSPGSSWPRPRTTSPASRARRSPQLRLHYDWLARERDPDGDGLLTIILPDESGLDDSPKYDERVRLDAPRPPGYFWLVERCRRLGYDAARIVERYEEHVEDVLVNVFYALALRALARPGPRAGARSTPRARSGPRRRCSSAATTSTPACSSTWRAAASGRVHGLDLVVARAARADVPARGRPLGGWSRSTCSTRAATARRAGSRRWRSRSRLFNPAFAIWRCWRGPSWMNTAWLLVPAMRELGYARGRSADRPSLRGGRSRTDFASTTTRSPAADSPRAAFGFSTLLIDLLAHAGPEPANRPGTQADDPAVSWRSTRACRTYRRGQPAGRGHRPRAPTRGGWSCSPTSPGRWWKRTDELYETVRIGAGMDASGRLSEEAIVRGVETLTVFEHGSATRTASRPEDIHAIATSAIRDASNRDEFLDARARGDGAEDRGPLGAGRGSLRLRRGGQHLDADRRRRGRHRRRQHAADRGRGPAGRRRWCRSRSAPCA